MSSFLFDGKWILWLNPENIRSATLKHVPVKMQNHARDKIAPKANSGIILFNRGLTIYHYSQSCFEDLVLMNDEIKDWSYWLCQRNNCCNNLKLFVYKCAKFT